MFFSCISLRAPLRASLRACAAGAVALCATASWAHITLADQVALAGTGYRATLRVGHGCEGSPTTAVRVSIPAGLRGAKPMPKPGWTLATTTGPLDTPYDDHGKKVTEGVTSITWTATAGNALPDDQYDEFVLRGSLPPTAGAMWFKVLQTCQKGSTDWAEVPASGTSTKGMKAPAALLEIIPSGHAAGHNH